MRVEFHDEASAELIESAAYYQTQARGLGERFLFQARMTIDRLIEMPGRGREIEPGVRKLKLPHFPYGIIYELHHETIFILAVANLMREPGYWRQRRK